MINKFILVTGCLLSITFFNAQVGVNTTQPKATLDVAGNPTDSSKLDGVLIPRLSGDQLVQKNYSTDQTGAMVYVNQVPTSNTGQIINVKEVGFYLFDGSKWKSLNAPSYFFMPSLVLPTNSANLPSYATFNTGVFTIDLYSVYANQLGLQGNVSGATKTALASNPSSKLPVLNASSLDYFVTYFDNTVFDPSSISLSTDGKLSYQILSGSAITEKTFMNIVFKEK